MRRVYAHLPVWGGTAAGAWLFPGTYGTSLLRNHALGGVLAEMESQGVPAAVTSAIGKAVDCKLDFYGNQVGRNAMYLIVAGSVAVLLGGVRGNLHLEREKGPEIRGPGGSFSAGGQHKRVCCKMVFLQQPPL